MMSVISGHDNPWVIYTAEEAPNVPIFLMGILNNEGLLDSVI